MVNLAISITNIEQSNIQKVESQELLDKNSINLQKVESQELLD